MVMTLPGGTGIVGKVGNEPRFHVQAHQWGTFPFATDYWFYPHADLLTASSPHLLSACGWITNGTVSIVAGSGGDFLSSSDRGTPTHLLCDATGERLTSPFVFGGDHVTRHIRRQLGWEPTKLIAEFSAIWTTASNADTTGGIGFVEAGGSIQTANDHMAMLTSDGTNFILRSGAETTTFALAVDTDPHIWRIIIDKGQAKVFFEQDGTMVGTSTTGAIAVQADLWPAAFGIACTSNNDLGLGPCHIYYD